MSVPYTAGNVPSSELGKVEKATNTCYVQQNLPKEAPVLCCPTTMPSNRQTYFGGTNSSSLLYGQLQQYAICNYQQQVQLAQARGQIPGNCQPPSLVIQSRPVAPAPCTMSQEYLNVNLPKPVDTCYNLIGITQKRIN
jgi:hypothetical protein